MTGTVNSPNWKKLFAQMLAGAVFGAAVSGAILYFWKDHGLDTADSAQVLAFTAGMIYALIGLMVGGLSFVPSAGAQLLNVEDVEDLRDQQPILRLSAAVCLLIGLFFLILAIVPIGGSGGLVSREVAVAVAAICLVPLVIMTRMTNRMVDELTQKVSSESSALTLHLAFILFGGWAALAHLGYLAWVSPLAFIAGLALLQLVAVFWVGVRRGMVAIPEQKRA